MSRALAPLGAAAIALTTVVAAPERAHAICSVLSHHPCTPYFGSVLRHRPFTPYSCGVTGGPCSPEVPLVPRESPVLKIDGHDGPPELADTGHPVDRLDEISAVLSKCLSLPRGDEAKAGMEVALRLAFKRDGALLADPRFTYTREASQRVKAAYHMAALDMLRRCTPLPVTAALGGAIAGRPFVLAIRDARGLTPGDPPAGAPQDARPQDARPQDARPQDARPQDARPQDPLSRHTPNDSVPDDSLPQDVFPKGSLESPPGD